MLLWGIRCNIPGHTSYAPFIILYLDWYGLEKNCNAKWADLIIEGPLPAMAPRALQEMDYMSQGPKTKYILRVLKHMDIKKITYFW